MKKDNLLHLLMLFHKYINVVLFDPLTAAGSEITSAQLLCLRYIYLNPNLTAGDLADGLNVSCGACTRAMDRLEQKGLAMRVTNPKDRRVQQMSLTPKGKEYVERAAEQLEEKFKDIIERFSQTERTSLEEILCTFLDRGLDQLEEAEDVCLRCGVLHMVDCPASKSRQKLLAKRVSS